MSWPAPSPPLSRTGPLFRLAGLALLLLPAGVLAGVSQRVGDWQQPALLAAAAVLGALALWLVGSESVHRAIVSKNAIAVYALALAWLWYCLPDHTGWVSRLAAGVLLTVPMFLLGVQEVYATTSAAPRRAHLLLHRLSQRQDWPTTISEIRAMPQVAALRETLREDPTPALMLLMHPRAEVRLAVLAALAYRPRWKKGQALLVMQVIKYAREPAVRVAAATALAHVTDPNLLGQLASYLRDPEPSVRKATAEALFTDIRDRWPAVRHGVRAALSDPRCSTDGALPCPGVLPALALSDLTVWAGEIGVVGKRAALTLTRYYRRAVQEDPSPQLIAHLSEQMLSGGVPAAVRVEMAHMVRDAGGLAPNALGRMLDSDQPGPLRLLAAEAVLQQGEDTKAEEVLREVARQPNRELAIAAAVVIQKCLRVDMGLPISQPPPPPQSKQGAEVTRRVMQWAMQKPPPAATSSPSSGSVPAVPPPLPAQTVSEPPVVPVGFGLTDTPIPQPTPQHLFFSIGDTADPRPAESPAAAEPSGRPDTKTPWVW